MTDRRQGPGVHPTGAQGRGSARKQDQSTERLTRGVVKDILKKSSYHPHGIKVRLETSEVGRVKEVIEEG